METAAVEAACSYPKIYPFLSWLRLPWLQNMVVEETLTAVCARNGALQVLTAAAGYKTPQEMMMDE